MAEGGCGGCLTMCEPLRWCTEEMANEAGHVSHAYNR
jgi:hypothetical protein